jgi:gas vesicle protein
MGDLVMGMIAGAAVGTVAGAVVESARSKDR